MIKAVKEQIRDAILELALSASEMSLLSDEDGRNPVNMVVSDFVVGSGRRWWWENFRFPSTDHHFEDQQGFARITQIVPNKGEKVWFIAEDDRQPFYPVYEATPEAIQAVLGECFHFEYYLIAKDLGWLLCEN